MDTVKIRWDTDSAQGAATPPAPIAGPGHRRHLYPNRSPIGPAAAAQWRSPGGPPAGTTRVESHTAAKWRPREVRPAPATTRSPMRRSGKFWHVNDAKDQNRRPALAAPPREAPNPHRRVSSRIFPYLSVHFGPKIRKDTQRYRLSALRGSATSADLRFSSRASFISQNFPDRRIGRCVVAGTVRASHGKTKIVKNSVLGRMSPNQLFFENRCSFALPTTENDLISVFQAKLSLGGFAGRTKTEPWRLPA